MKRFFIALILIIVAVPSFAQTKETAGKPKLAPDVKQSAAPDVAPVRFRDIEFPVVSRDQFPAPPPDDFLTDRGTVHALNCLCRNYCDVFGDEQCHFGAGGCIYESSPFYCDPCLC